VQYVASCYRVDKAIAELAQAHGLGIDVTEVFAKHV
jgi:hypothetical protein